MKNLEKKLTRKISINGVLIQHVRTIYIECSEDLSIKSHDWWHNIESTLYLPIKMVKSSWDTMNINKTLSLK